MPDGVRRVELYRDAGGTCEVADVLRWLARSNGRAYRAVRSRLDLLAVIDLRQALGGKLVKRASPSMWILRVQSGPASFRLPFFVVARPDEEVAVVTHCENRAKLKRDRYQQLVEAAERRREDWISRMERGEIDAGP